MNGGREEGFWIGHFGRQGWGCPATESGDGEDPATTTRSRALPLRLPCQTTPTFKHTDGHPSGSSRARQLRGGRKGGGSLWGETPGPQSAPLCGFRPRFLHGAHSLACGLAAPAANAGHTKPLSAVRPGSNDDAAVHQVLALALGLAALALVHCRRGPRIPSSRPRVLALALHMAHTKAFNQASFSRSTLRTRCSRKDFRSSRRDGSSSSKMRASRRAGACAERSLNCGPQTRGAAASMLQGIEGFEEALHGACLRTSRLGAPLRRGAARAPLPEPWRGRHAGGEGRESRGRGGLLARARTTQAGATEPALDKEGGG